MKRLFDLAGACAGLIVFAPIMAVIAVAVLVDDGRPVFFRQARLGLRRRPFTILKFRSMRDGRVTRVGRILRGTNLDELPQLLNVIAGDMSLVGPRPHAVAHNNEYEEKIRLYARRHNVKPGITGWAQVNGYRGRTDSIDKMRQRVEHDLYYIDHWSLMFDIKILLMTLLSPSSYRNAY